MWTLAGIEHHAAIIEMCAALYREDPSPEPITEHNIKKTLQELAKNPIRGQAVVLLVNEEVVGYALLISFWSNEMNGEIGMIDELYVKPKFRGQGFATQLIQALMNREITLSHPLAAIDLEVTPSNERAKKLYSNLGFKTAKNTHMRFRFY